MGDHAPATLTIFAWPDDVEKDVLALLEAHYFALEFYEPLGNSLRRGIAYGSDDASLGVSEDIGTPLIEMGVSFTLAQDAKYEFDGTVMMHDPTLGTFHSTGSNGGGLLITESDVNGLLQLLDDDCDACGNVAFKIRSLTAQKWQERFAQLLKGQG